MFADAPNAMGKQPEEGGQLGRAKDVGWLPVVEKSYSRKVFALYFFYFYTNNFLLFFLHMSSTQV